MSKDTKDNKDAKAGDAKLKIVGITGRDLLACDVDGKSDPYCIVQLLVDGKADARQYKTKVIKSNLNPSWDQLDFAWDQPPADAKSVEIFVQVWDSDVTYDDFIGQTKICVKTLQGGPSLNKLTDKTGTADKARGSVTVTLDGAKKYTLKYFPGFGAGEISRCLFKVAGVDFNDVRIPSEKWPEEKPKMPFGQLPVLELPDGCLVPQSQAIERFIARTYDLYGKTPKCAARIDIAVETLLDISKEIYGLLLDFTNPPQGKNFRVIEGKESQEKWEGWTTKKWPAWGDALTAQFKKANDGKGFWLGDHFSYADVAFWHRFTLIQKYSPKVFDKYELLKGWYDRVSKNEALAKWAKERPDAPF